MGLKHTELHAVDGLQFFKLLGTGSKGGFSMFPDFSTYVFLSVWQSKEYATHFYENSSFYTAYKDKAARCRVLHLGCIQSHGLWGGVNPFKPDQNTTNNGGQKIVVLTRANVRWSRLLEFWRHVPLASKSIAGSSGVLFYKGIGEWPLVQQATISIWNDLEAVKNYAYKQPSHSSIVKKTLKNKWYGESLFSRFNLISDTTY